MPCVWFSSDVTYFSSFWLICEFIQHARLANCNISPLKPMFPYRMIVKMCHNDFGHVEEYKKTQIVSKKVSLSGLSQKGFTKAPWQFWLIWKQRRWRSQALITPWWIVDCEHHLGRFLLIYGKLMVMTFIKHTNKKPWISCQHSLFKPL